MAIGYKALAGILLGLGSTLLYIRGVQAQVVINEFLPDVPSGQSEDQDEWVELYNTSDAEINLHGWVLKDSDDNHQRLITATSIGPRAFVTVKRNGSNFSLNNSADTVRLFESTHSAQPVDSFAYSETFENQSWGRLPDGTGSFHNNLNPSSGQPNQALPTATPKPEPTAKPTKEDIANTQSNQSGNSANTGTTSETNSNQQSTPRGGRAAISKTAADESVLGFSDETATDSAQATTSAGIIDRSSLASASAQATDSAKSNFIQSGPTKLPLIFLTTGAAFITAGFAPTLIQLIQERE